MEPAQTSLFMTILIGFGIGSIAPSQRAAAADPQPQTVALVLDTSGSMEGQKLRHLQEAAKLLIAILDREIVIVDFDDSATSKSFPLGMVADRRDAMAYVDKLRSGGGTDYLAALGEVKSIPAATPIIFVSDGENTNGTDADVLAFVRKNIRGRLITIGVEAPKGVDHLLARMAAATGGQHVRVDKAEDLVKTLLDCTVGLANYRSHKPQQSVLDCRQVRGRALVFAYDAAPAMTASPGLTQPPFEYQASLPGEHVTVQTVDLARPTDLHVSIRDPKSKRARLAHVLRSDLTRATLHVDGAENAVTGGTVHVSTEFHAPSGTVVDPRGRSDLNARYHITDADGRTLTAAQGKPSHDKPRLEATLTLPEEPGEHTVVQETEDKSTGTAFTAEEKRTLIVERAMTLVAEPSRLSAGATVGQRLNATLRIRPGQAGVSLPSDLSAAFSRPSDAVDLVETKTQGDTLHLSLVPKKPGVHQGLLLISARSPSRFVPLSVPYVFAVNSPLRGLTIPDGSHKDLGTVLPGAGLTKLGPIEIASHDGQPAVYAVEVSDLSNGTDIIPLDVQPATVTPTASQAARVELAAQVGDVSPGAYQAHVDLILQSDPTRRWKLDLSLLVSQPLTASPVDFGNVSPGQIRERRLTVHNAAGAMPDVSVAVDPVDAGGDKIAVTLAERVSLPAGQQTAIDVSLAVSPLATSRGQQETIVRFRRAGREILQVPVTLTIVDSGEASTLLISPTELHLRASAGSVVEFAFTVKLTHDATAPDQLTLAAGTFQDESQRPVSVTTALESPRGNVVTQGRATAVKGYLVAPDKTGTYRGAFTVSTTHNGQCDLPVTLEVHP